MLITTSAVSFGCACVEQAKSETDAVIYNNIRRRQQAVQACFVYIRGLPTISNGATLGLSYLWHLCDPVWELPSLPPITDPNPLLLVYRVV